MKQKQKQKYEFEIRWNKEGVGVVLEDGTFVGTMKDSGLVIGYKPSFLKNILKRQAKEKTNYAFISFNKTELEAIDKGLNEAWKKQAKAKQK